MASILVVDDEEGLRSFLCEALGGSHTTMHASNGEEGLALARKHAFDVVLSDLKMPKMDGLTLLHHLREEQPEVEVILLTAHGDVSTAVEAMRKGAFDFLEKPLGSPAELRQLVARAVERKQLLSAAESVARQRTRDGELSFGARAMVEVLDAIDKVAPTDASVLLLGESGTGKEVAARAIHARSARAERPFVAVNCAALAPQLIESELFGHEKGAFTGADGKRRGRIELAEGGTFFLDEIGELEPKTQAKLLRVLQERTYERVGGTQTLHAKVRWIAATNRDLHGMIREGSFREDLYHRLAVFPIQLPPLRMRAEDIPGLCEALLQRIGEDLGRRALKLSPEALERLRTAPWPGNIRELRNTLERAAILAGGAQIEGAHIRFDQPAQGKTGCTLVELEKQAIAEALDASGGNRKDAAERLGIGVRTLYDKLKRYGLS